MTFKKALVTGGSRGLGLEIARLLAGTGCPVTIVAREPKALEEALRSLPGTGHRAWTCDLSHPVATLDLARRMEGDPFDLLINNAGASRFGRLQDLPVESVGDLLHLNLTAPAILSRQFFRSAAPGATLVNVSSIVATTPMPGNSLYSAAKAGLKALSECLWFEGRAAGIRVLEFRPVSLRTDFHRRAGMDSLAAGGSAVDPATAARAMMEALAGGRDFARTHGFLGKLLVFANRLLPRRFVVSSLGKKAVRAGYLAPQPPTPSR